MSTDSDRTEIGVVLAGIESGFNANDAAAMTAWFADDVRSVEPDGRELTGRAAVIAQYAEPNDQYARFTVRDLAFPSPDVAVVIVDVVGVDGSGARIDLDHVMVATYLLVRRAGDWWVAARQHAVIAGRS